MTTDRDLGGRTPDPMLLPISDIQMDPARHLCVADGRPALRGSRCDACGNEAFPKREVCLACGGRSLHEVALPGQGTLYTYSTVHVSASRATPYTIGYVDLQGGVRLLAQIRGAAGDLALDRPVRLELEAGDWFFVPERLEHG